MTEAYNEHKFWNRFGADFFVVGGKRGCAAGAFEFVPREVRTAFEDYWRTLHGTGVNDDTALVEACQVADIRYYKSWRALENETGYPYREAIQVALDEWSLPGEDA